MRKRVLVALTALSLSLTLPRGSAQQPAPPGIQQPDTARQPVAAQPVEPLTLAEAKRIALQNNPQIDSARLIALAAGQGPAQFRSGLLPVLSLNATGAGATPDSRLGAGVLNNPVIYSRFATGFSVSQLLYDFGRTARLVESSSLRARAEQANVQTSQAFTLLQVTQAYFDALRADAVVRVAERTLQARQLVLEQVTALTDAQLKSSLDQSFAEVRVSEARLLLETARNQRAAADAELSLAQGYTTPRRFAVAEESTLPIFESNAATLAAQAAQGRPELANRRLELEAALQFAAAERALRLPSISAVGSAGFMPAHVEGIRRSEYAAAGLNINVPFLNGGLYKARQAEAELRAQAARQRVRELENRILRDVTVAVLNTTSARERFALSERLVAQATEALSLAQSRYELGLSSIVELSQAQLDQTQAELQQTAARYDFQLQRSVLDYQIGALR